jgi:hypothetical protein
MSRLALPEYDENTLFIRRVLPVDVLLCAAWSCRLLLWVNWSRLYRLSGGFFGGVVISREGKSRALTPTLEDLYSITPHASFFVRRGIEGDASS